MARPNIVRADTLDLQDQENPTASLHHKQSPDLNHSGLAPHQAAEVHHVLEERHSEEQSLADAWNISNDLTKDPDAIEQAQTNGDHDSGEDDNGNTESEGDGEGDDDMMDRISSSPSIDDGGYTPKLHSPAQMASWPARSTSLTPSPTSSRAGFNSPTSSLSTLRSSPLSCPLQHLPLRRPASATNEGLPFPSALTDHYSSALNETSTLFPPVGMHNASFPLLPSKHHQRLGRYGSDLELDSTFEEHNGKTNRDEEAGAVSENTFEADRKGKDLGSEQEGHGSGVSRATEWSPMQHFMPHRRTEFPPADFGSLAQSSRASTHRLDLTDVSLPIDSQLLDRPPSSCGSDSSWEDVSDSESDFDDSEAGNRPDDDADIFLDLDNRFIDSGWGGECLRDTEDIDFEFVYALHTFVATVEGQANATKGDTMVLLDDSNSYWWLVRVVKDSSIGYLPAEHIETPTERLARLNKHRNIDLSATMLSDNSEKSRNPIKKAMRRRNAKTVQFAAPTYVEASDYDYSSEEEDPPTLDPYAANVHNTDGQEAGTEVDKSQQDGDDDNAAEVDEGKVGNPSRASFDREQAASAVASIDEPQLSPRLVDKTEAAPLKSRKGTPRNTDSFLKDDSIETRKITLTPGILREDAASTKSASSESARNNSMESLEKVVSPPEPQIKKELKEQKKKDAKKGGMLSGLFKSKKDKKKTKDDAGEQSAEKASSEMSRESPRASPFTSGNTSPVEKFSGPQIGATETKQRPPVVLQPPPLKSSLQKRDSQEVISPVREAEIAAENKAFVAELPGSEVAVEMAADSDLPPAVSSTTTTTLLAPTTSEKEAKESPLSPLTNMLRSNSKDPKPAKAKRSKQRVELDDFDSPADSEGPNPFKEQEERGGRESLTDSPVEITSDATNTYMHGTEIIHIPTPAVGDSATGSEDGEPASLSSSPSIIEHPAEPASDTEEEDLVQDNNPTPTGPHSPETPTNTTQQIVLPLRKDSISTPTEPLHPAPTVRTLPSAAVWSDSSLRSWLEDGTEVRDMLLMIHDKAGVVPVGTDHPIMKGLYDRPRKGVQDLMSQLDGLLGTFIQKRGLSLP